jgi:hypothetical protein
MLGVVLLHLLLVPGTAFLTGGARIWEQKLHPHRTQLNLTLLTVGSVPNSSCLPRRAMLTLKQCPCANHSRCVFRCDQRQYNHQRRLEPVRFPPQRLPSHQSRLCRHPTRHVRLLPTNTPTWNRVTGLTQSLLNSLATSSRVSTCTILRARATYLCHIPTSRLKHWKRNASLLRKILT